MELKLKTPSSLHVEWSDVPIMLQNGKILDYLLILEEINSTYEVVVSQNTFNFTNLKEFHNYNVSIKARNMAGFGSKLTIQLKTEETSEYTTNYHRCVNFTFYF